MCVRTKTAGEYQAGKKENQDREIETRCQKDRHDFKKGNQDADKDM